MLKVLVCDNHPLCREGLTQVVSRLEDGIEAIPVGTYPEILAALATHGPFGLILVERNLMPVADGDGIADLVRRAGSAPVVVVSAEDSRDAVVQATTAGAAGFLLKSSPIVLIQQVLRTVRDGGTSFPSDVPAPGIAVPVSIGPHDTGAPSETDRERIALLTHRQRDVLALLGEGRSNKDIAEVLGISEGTVKVHVGAILKALGTSNRTQAALIAIDSGIATLPHDAGRVRRA